MARGRGRPTKLTPAVQERICRALAKGNTRANAAKAGGVDYKSMRTWERKGQNQKAGQYRDFLLQLMAVEQEAESKRVEGIERAGDGEDEVTVTEVYGPPTKKDDGTIEPGPLLRREVKTTRKRSWQAHAWWLERQRANDWAAKASKEIAALTAQVEELRKAIKGDGK